VRKTVIKTKPKKHNIRRCKMK